MNTHQGAKQHEIIVDEETCIVWTAKNGNSWIAYGNFRGKPIPSIRGRTERNAVSAWTQRANVIANE